MISLRSYLSMFIVALVVTVPAAAQEDSPKPQGGLADRQEVVRERVSRLEDRMFQISQAIKQSDPEKAARLLESLGAARGMGVRRKMEDITKKLREEHFSDATEAQEAVVADLQSLLRLMIEEPEKLEDRKKEIDRLQVLREHLEKIITEQKQEKSDAESSATTPEQAKAAAEALESTKGLLDQQHALTTRTAQQPTDAKQTGADQAELKKSAEQLAEKMKALPGQPASEELSAAAAKMKAAEDWLAKEQVPDAGESQKEAEEKLESAIQKLQEHLKKLQEKKPLPDQAAKQRETSEKTKGLSKDLQSQDGQKSPPGDNNKKQSDKPSNDTPQSSDQKQDGIKQEEVEGASKLQDDAAKNLDESKPDEAAKKQDEALKKLEEAQKKLQDALEQLRKEQQEEMLAALEARFRAMLAKQIECSKASQRLVELPTAEWKRSDQLDVGEITTKQKSIGEDADATLFILKEEGTTVIFPQIVRQVRDDAREAVSLLAPTAIPADVRRLQDGIEQVLRELLDAVKKKQEEAENEEKKGGAAGQDSPQPLLPGSAELKLLRSCQLRVNTATQALKADRAKAGDTAEARERLQRLAKRQEEVSTMAKEMHESMTKAQ
ncbi:MAG: hypothetical protein AABZ08_09120 [Planctomycetota bacterium]